MKVKITKSSKQMLNWHQAEKAKEIVQSMKEHDCTGDLEILAGLFYADAPKTYHAEITRNCFVWDALDIGSEDLDVYIEVELPEVWEDGHWVIYKVTCYLTDIWQVASDNREKIKNRMWIRKFVEERKATL